MVNKGMLKNDYKLCEITNKVIEEHPEMLVQVSGLPCGKQTYGIGNQAFNIFFDDDKIEVFYINYNKVYEYIKWKDDPAYYIHYALLDCFTRHLE